MARQLFLLFHRYAGLFMAFFLVVAGITGAAIAFYDELDAGLNPELFQVANPNTPPLPLDELARIAEEQLIQGRAVLRYTRLPRHENDSLNFFVAPKRDAQTGEKLPLNFNSIFIDPYTGKVLGTRYFGKWQFDRVNIMPLLWDIHYSLTLPGAYGHWLFGAVALIWVFDCFFAAYLTFPRQRKKFLAKWGKAWRIKLNAGKARLIRDVHIAFSLWLWAFLLMFAISGVMFNLGGQVYDPVLSALVEYEYVRDKLPAVSSEEREQQISLEQARQLARQYIEAWQSEESFEVYSEDSISLDLGKYAFRFKFRSSLGLPEAYAQTAVYLSASDGRLLARSHPYVDTGNAISSWLAALHRGRIFGLWYQVVVCVSGMLVAVLSISGVMIWWRKRQRKLVKQSQLPSEPVPLVALHLKTQERE